MAKDIQGNVGQIVPMEIVLENVTTGVSGFQLTMQVADPSVAIVESVDFLPEYADPNTGFSFNSAIAQPPASTIVTAVDLGQAIEPAPPKGYVLFTLQIKLLLSARTTSIIVSSVGKLNDDLGADIVAQPIPGSVAVD